MPVANALESTLIDSTLGPDHLLGDNPTISETSPFLINSNDLADFVAYQYADNEAQFYDGELGGDSLRTPYPVLPGAVVCAVAIDNSKRIYLAENRVVDVGTPSVRFTAARIVVIDALLGQVIDTWYSVVGPTCAIEATPEGLRSIGLSDLSPFAALYQ
jgi:hypothetical protein